MDSTPEKAESAFDPTLGSEWKSKVKTTSSAVIGLPSLNVTPRLSLNVHSLASRLGFQLSASTGTSLRSPLDTERYWAVCWSITAPPVSPTATGSTAPVGVTIADRMVPPRFFVAGVPAVAEREALSDPPHALTIVPSTENDMPTTVPRRTNSRREIRPAMNSSMTWLSSSLRPLRAASSRVLCPVEFMVSPTRRGSDRGLRLEGDTTQRAMERQQ